MDGADRVCLCAVTGAHGIGGEVRLKAFTEDPADVGAYGPLSSEDGQRSFRVGKVRVSGGKVVARLSGVDDRTAAEALKGMRLYVARTALPDPDEEEWYHADLLGLACRTADGTPAGAIRAVHDFGAGDVLEIADRDDGDTLFLPFTQACVPEVNVKGGWIVIEPPVVDEGDEDEDTAAERGRGTGGS